MLGHRVDVISSCQRADAVRPLTPEFSRDPSATGWMVIRSMEISRTGVEAGVWEITVAAPPNALSDPKLYRLSTSL